MPPPWASVKDIFQTAAELDEPERGRYLDSACGADAELRRAVERLLAGDAVSDDFLGSQTETVPLRRPVFSSGEILAGRFEIIRLIGRGGMGEVYEARDRQLDHLVALKTILPELVHSSRVRDRFKREILLARQVSHKNVCRIYDLAPDLAGHRDALLFSMELLEGETLAAYLKHRDRLSTEEALPLVRQMAAGLAALHQEKIVHRDFKPGNVMLVRDGSGETQVKITDFGLARPMVRSGGDDTAATESRDVLGTPRYMAPEQLAGKKAVRATDVYALGLVMYEMVTGKRPYDAKSVGENAVQKQSPPPPPIEHVEDLPSRWNRTILHCLQRLPEERPQDVSRLTADLEKAAETKGAALVWERLKQAVIHPKRRWLRWAALAVALFALASVVAIVVGPPETIPVEKHIAVLPFQNVGEDPEGQALCDGLAETITSVLTQLQEYQGSLWVVPASEVRDARVTSAREARREFNVNLAITGSVQRFGDRFALAVNLVDAETRRQLRSASLEVTLATLAADQARIVARVTELLELEIGVQSQRILAATETSVSQARELCLLGRGYLWRFDREGNIDRAIQVFSEAHALDENYAPALAGLAEAQLRKSSQTADIKLLETATRNAERAVRESPMLAASRVTLGLILRTTGDRKRAIEEFEAALTYDPRSAVAHTELANTYRDFGMAPEAEKAYRDAIGLRPKDWRFHNSLAVLYYQQGRYDEAEAELKQVVHLAPRSNRGYRNLGAVYRAMGRYDDAYSALQKALAIQPTAKIYDNIGGVLFDQGRYAESADAFRQAIDQGEPSYITWANLADALRWTPDGGTDAKEAYQRAIGLGKEMLSATPNDGRLLVRVAAYHAKSESCGEALDRLGQVPENAWNDLYVKARAATVYELCDRRPDALDMLAAALGGGYSSALIDKDPDMAKLRQDPRYRDILANLDGQ